MRRYTALVLLVLFVVTLVVSGCGSSGSTTGTSPGSSAGSTPGKSESASTGVAGLPREMVWTSYDVTASGYIHAAAMADALNKKFGTTIRIIPSGNSVGRLMPLVQGKARYGFLGDEAMFAADGTYDFADITWGPQNIRTVLACSSTISFFTSKENYEKGLRTPRDFKGARVPYIPGSPTTNVKVDAFLAFAGLTRDDVKIVEYPNFAANNRGLIEKTCDLGIAVPTGAICYEIDSSPVGLYRLEFPAADKEGWARFNKVFPTFFPKIETAGPAIHKPGGIEEVGFRFPHIITYASTPDDEVYALTKALHETYDAYKGADPFAIHWEIREASNYPASAPFHPGAVKYFKEVGIWTDKHEEWNNKAVKKAQALQEAWDKTVKEAAEKRITGKAFSDLWMKAREEALKTIG